MSLNNLDLENEGNETRFGVWWCRLLMENLAQRDVSLSFMDSIVFHHIFLMHKLVGCSLGIGLFIYFLKE